MYLLCGPHKQNVDKPETMLKNSASLDNYYLSCSCIGITESKHEPHLIENLKWTTMKQQIFACLENIAKALWEM